MTRRASMLILSGAVLVMVALLSVIVMGPQAQLALRIAMAAGALTGSALIALGGAQGVVLMRRALHASQQREERLSARVAQLRDELAQHTGPGRSHQRQGAQPATAAHGQHHDAELHASVTSALAAVNGRLDRLEDNAASNEHAWQSQSTWAHQIESSLWAQRRDIESVGTKTTEARQHDHARMAEIERTSYELAVRAVESPDRVLTPVQARTLASRFARSSDYLRLKPLIHGDGVLDTLELKRIVAAGQTYRRYGYLSAYAALKERIAEITGDQTDRGNAIAARDEADFFRDPTRFTADVASPSDAHDPSGPVIHIVGKALPETQSGYTLRTQYTLKAQHRVGIDSFVMCQSGSPGGDPDEKVENIVDGVRYVILPGVARHETTFQAWIAHNIREAMKVVTQHRPSVLHAHSDFLNALIAQAVGHACDVPVVYESRGFWEESWLSRNIHRNGLTGTHEDFYLAYGMPDAYTWRRDAEVVARENSDVNLTLGRTMREHIEELAGGSTPGRAPIRLVPNGIDTESFRTVARDPELAATLGIEPGQVVIGCISSIVEYEGIDLLIRAFDRLPALAGQEASRGRLLIVGDGAELDRLKELAAQLGRDDIIFTGRIPHSEVLPYYGLIDVFVMPRKPTSVSRLVSPLKPMEALATGCALVVSDLEALKEIAEDSNDAVEQFPAGDEHALAEVLHRLIVDRERRESMAARGAEWVRTERTWDANAPVYLEVYRELLRSHSASGDQRASGRSKPVQRAASRRARSKISWLGGW